MNTGVHDSYWTHACDVDDMNRILREKFVELYETPILENVNTSNYIYIYISFSVLFGAGRAQSMSNNGECLFFLLFL